MFKHIAICYKSVGVKNCRYEKGTGNREQGTGNRGQGTGNRLRRDGFGQLDFSLLMSVFSVHLLT
ncbi:MAG: hypothetical protein ACK5QF_02610 [Dolichospermum sp.]